LPQSKEREASHVAEDMKKRYDVRFLLFVPEITSLSKMKQKEKFFYRFFIYKN